MIMEKNKQRKVIFNENRIDYWKLEFDSPSWDWLIEALKCNAISWRALENMYVFER